MRSFRWIRLTNRGRTGLLRYAQALSVLVFVAAAATAQKPPAPPVLERAITFSDAKPLFGLPEAPAGTRSICSSDGLLYFAADSGEADGSALDVYTASAGAEVKRFRRAAPSQPGRISIRDFFASEHSLVALLEVDQPDERNPSAPPRERQDFLSVSDHVGDES